MQDLSYINWHTHTPLCKHASGNCEDFCRELPGNVRKIGFADHAPFPDGRYGISSMKYSQLGEYFAFLEEGRKKFPDIEIIAGLEAEWCPDLGRDFYFEYYFTKGIKYLIGSAHYSAVRGNHFLGYDTADTAVIDGFVMQTLDMISSRLFMYICHPDCYLCPMDRISPSLRSGFIDIIQAAKEFDTPLEYNCNGLRNGQTYPARAFWEIAAEYGVRTVVGSDAHRPAALRDRFWLQGISDLEELGLVPCNNELVPEIPAI